MRVTYRRLSLAALAGIALAVAWPVTSRVRLRQQEEQAIAMVEGIVRAQAAFRAGAGRGGFASSVASLTADCPNGMPAAYPVDLGGDDVHEDGGYEATVRASEGASPVSLDCFGRPTTSDFVVSARPILVGVDGLRAFAAGADGRVFAFFDGVPPVERDMAPGGLAVPLDQPVKIP